ncbi:MAG: tRNA lysidine(34) synthetase TilS [Planctomycetota bacterium]
MLNPPESPALVPIQEAIEAFLGRGEIRGPVWVACSGGVDSTALLAAAAGTRLRAAPLGVVHVDHGVHARRHEARDQVGQLAQSLGLRFQSFEVAPGHARETELRAARYALLRRLGDQDRAHAVLLGHHLEDQLETVLFRLRRGAGTRGLAGIPARRPLTNRCELWRPLLSIRRATLERACRELDLPIVEDPTNRDLGPSRNRLRHVEIPALRQRHHSFDERLLSIRERANARNERLEAQARTFLEEESLRSSTGTRSIPLASLRSVDEATSLEICRQLCAGICGSAVSTDLLRRLHQLGRQGQRGQRIEAHPRLSVRHDGQMLIFAPRTQIEVHR